MDKNTEKNKAKHSLKIAAKAIKLMKQNGVYSINDFHAQVMKNKEILADESRKIESLNETLSLLKNVNKGINNCMSKNSSNADSSLEK